MGQTKVSIIIPTRHDRGYLRWAVESAQRQTFPSVQVVVQKGDFGVGKNINDALDKCKGDLICYIADDDLLARNAAALAVNNIGDADFIHGNAWRFKSTTKMTYYKPAITKPTLHDLIKKNHIHGGTVWYRNEVIKQHRFDESLWTGEEYEMHLRMLKNGCKITYINEVMFYYRLHDLQKSIGVQSNDYTVKRMIEIQRIKNMYK
jgi:glycosyltransferase involved in cell wall biosynthesis